MIRNVGLRSAVDMDVRRLFSFPDPVTETSARLVASGVVAQALLFLVVREGWLLVPLVYGFAARVLTGPSLSPLGQFATRVGTPLLEWAYGFESRRVPGPPKRFAQAIGSTVSAAAAAAWLAGWSTVAVVLIGLLLVAAALEAVAAICLGCIAYTALWGCDDCDDISERLRMAASASRRVADPSPADPDPEDGSPVDHPLRPGRPHPVDPAPAGRATR